MKCPKCQAENKEGVKSCRKCGLNLQMPPLWKPTWAWHAKVLVLIYIGVVVVFFVMKFTLKPYVRSLPPEITPWLHSKGGARAHVP